MRSLAQQAFALRGRFPSAETRLSVRQLMCEAILQPTPASRRYTVQIKYVLSGYPEVRVLRPDLDSLPGKSIPHVFDNGCLCLHMDDEWSPRRLIADTIVPWTSEWLINYEIWKATTEWYGGGQWPPSRPPAEEGTQTSDPNVPPAAPSLSEDDITMTTGPDRA